MTETKQVRNKTGDHQIQGSGPDFELHMAAPNHFSPKKQLEKKAATDPCQEFSSAIHSKHVGFEVRGALPPQSRRSSSHISYRWPDPTHFPENFGFWRSSGVTWRPAAAWWWHEHIDLSMGRWEVTRNPQSCSCYRWSCFTCFSSQGKDCKTSPKQGIAQDS